MNGKGKEISLINGTSEYVTIDSLQSLDQQSRAVAEDALEKNYLIPEIIKIISTDVFQGNRYFEVDTNRGRCRFVIRNPFIAIRKTPEDGMILRDVVGNQYTIPSLSKLDAKSKHELEKMC